MTASLVWPSTLRTTDTGPRIALTSILPLSEPIDTDISITEACQAVAVMAADATAQDEPGRRRAGRALSAAATCPEKHEQADKAEDAYDAREHKWSLLERDPNCCSALSTGKSTLQTDGEGRGGAGGVGVPMSGPLPMLAPLPMPDPLPVPVPAEPPSRSKMMHPDNSTAITAGVAMRSKRALHEGFRGPWFIVGK